MSAAMFACILIQLDIREGQWIPLDELTRFVGAARDKVKEHAMQAVQQNLITHAVIDGCDLFGVKVEGVKPEVRR